MRAFHLLTLAALVLAPASAWAQSMPTYWRLADPEAKLLMGIDLKALLNSPMAGDWKTQLEKATGSTAPLEMIQAMDEGGALADLFQHTDRVFISLGEIPQAASAKPRGTVALVGDFDLPALRKFMAKQGGAKTVFRGVEVWQSGKAADNVMIALASPQVLALGDRASVRKAVSQFAVGDGSVMGSPVYQRAASLAQANDVWIAGEILEPPTKSTGMVDALAKLVQSFDLGVRTRNGLDLELNLYADGEQGAKDLAAAVQGVIQMAAAGQENPQATEFFSRLNMGTEGDRLQLAASWTQVELAAVMRQTGKSSKTPVLAANRTTPVLAAEPPKPRQPLKVRIYNPDAETVREFELRRE